MSSASRSSRMSLAVVFAMAVCSAILIGMWYSAPAAGQGGPEPLVMDDHAGFESIFDGSTSKDWDGDPNFWRVENEAIVGESTADKPLKTNTFMIWRGGRPKDFELKVQYRINSTNSG